MRQLIKDNFNTKDKVGLSNLKIDANIDYRKNKIANDCIEADMMIGESETKAFQKELSDLRIETTDKSENAMLKTLVSNNLLTFKDTLKYVFSLGLIFILLALSALTKDVIFSSLMVSFSIIIGSITFHQLRTKKINNHQKDNPI